MAESIMSGVRALCTYSRPELEIEVQALRLSLAVARQDLESMGVRSEQAILDTARCASLTSIITSMALCVSRRRYRAANEIAVMALEDT